MTLEEIYVVRHGFRSAWSVDPATGVYTASIPSPTGIAADPALTSHGLRQAEELGRHLIKIQPPIDAVYSSPYYRCLQTITPYVNLRRQHEELNKKTPTAASTIRPERGISEWFGAAPFQHPEPAPAETLRTMFPAYSTDYVSAQTPSRMGETLAQLYERVAAAVRGIIEQCDAEGHRSIVLCSHAAVVIVLGRVLTGDIPNSSEVDDFQAYTCGLSLYRRKRGHQQSTYEQDKGVGGWACELNSDCSFLSNGPERGWKFAGDESFPGTGSMSQESESKL